VHTVGVCVCFRVRFIVFTNSPNTANVPAALTLRLDRVNDLASFDGVINALYMRNGTYIYYVSIHHQKRRSANEGQHQRRRGTSLESCDEIAVGPHQWRHHQQESLSEDRGAFQNGSARTRSDADAAHMGKASGIMQMRQTRRM